VHLLSRYLPASVQRYTPYLGGGSMGVSRETTRKQTEAFLGELQALLRDSALAHQLLARILSGRSFAAVRASVLKRLAGLDGVGTAGKGPERAVGPRARSHRAQWPTT
jgi:hypothetical protein